VIWAQAIALLCLIEAVPSHGVRLTPTSIQVGALYQDVPVRVEAVAQPGSQMLVVLRGADTKETFNKKGRVGPVWLNVGKVHISGVPSLFLSFSAAPVQSILSREEIDRYQLDEAAIRRQMRIEPAEFDQPELRSHYWSLKAEQRSYSVQTGALKAEAAGETGVSWRVEFLWPRKAQPGSYMLTAYECRQGRVIRQSTATLTVTRVGLPVAVAALAQQRPAQYAGLAVITAMIAGFGIDFVVSRLGGKRRKLRAAHGAGEAEPEREPTGSRRRGGH